MVTVIQTAFSGPCVVGGGINTLCFSDPGGEEEADDLAVAVGDFWGDLMAYLDEDLSFMVLPGAKRYAASTGALQEIFDTATTNADVGQVGGTSIPRASQALIRLRTADIQNNRLVQGRIFVPGVAGVHITDAGGVSSTVVTAFNTAADTLMSNALGLLAVWHRPVGGTGGSEHLVTSASTWDEWAVLRSRRD